MWAGLLSLGGQASLNELAQLVAAGEPGRQTLRTVQAVVAHLVDVGLVLVDDDLVKVTDSSAAEPPPGLVATIQRERALWSARCGRFEAGRLARARARLDRHQRWWDSLDPDEREARRRARAAWFADQPVAEQEVLRKRWEARRASAGVGVRDAHRVWCATHVTPARRRERRAGYQALPIERRRELVVSWVAWRAAHGIARWVTSARTPHMSQVTMPRVWPFPAQEVL